MKLFDALMDASEHARERATVAKPLHITCVPDGWAVLTQKELAERKPDRWRTYPDDGYVWHVRRVGLAGNAYEVA